MLFAAETVWHIWLSVALVATSILVVVGIVALYFFKVTRQRYPKEQA
jgi:biopolymer transport protein ExbB/TolQ